MEIGFDVIGDLFLSPDDDFDWDGKATSLYCIVTGNISNDMGKLKEVLQNLGENYKGVFYVSGDYEFHSCADIHDRIHTINHICQRTQGVAGLWHHVVVLENIAILGCNGWAVNSNEKIITHLNTEDILYLQNSIKKLQKHGDVDKIIVVSNSVPKSQLYFGKIPNTFNNVLNLDYCLEADTEKKVKYWAFGNCNRQVDIEIGNIKYLNNPYYKGLPYWPKRIELEI